MIFLAATEPSILDVYGASFSLEPLNLPEVNIGHILVVEDELGKRILQRDNHKIKRISFDAHRLPGFPEPLPSLDKVRPNSKILVIRGGGIGDVLMCTPAIRELRRRLPEDIQLYLATFKINESFFIGNPYLDSVMTQPMTLGELMQVDYYLEFKDPEFMISTMHMTDFYLQCLGINPLEVSDKRPILVPDFPYDPGVLKILKQANHAFKHTVYLNGLASDRLRDLSPETLYIFPRNYPDVLFIIPTIYIQRYGEKSKEILKAPNILHLDTEDSLPGYITAIDGCDAVISTDSSAYHIAAALGKPCMAFFGPISSKIRTQYYPTVIAVEADYKGRCCDSPCGKSMFSEFNSDRVNIERRCLEAILKGEDFSPCLSSFSHETLIGRFEEIMRRIN